MNESIATSRRGLPAVTSHMVRLLRRAIPAFVGLSLSALACRAQHRPATPHDIAQSELQARAVDVVLQFRQDLVSRGLRLLPCGVLAEAGGLSVSSALESRHRDVIAARCPDSTADRDHGLVGRLESITIAPPGAPFRGEPSTIGLAYVLLRIDDGPDTYWERYVVGPIPEAPGSASARVRRYEWTRDPRDDRGGGLDTR